MVPKVGAMSSKPSVILMLIAQMVVSMVVLVLIMLGQIYLILVVLMSCTAIE